MEISQTFIQTIQGVFGEKGRIWLGHLPRLIDAAVKRWELTSVTPVANLSYNFVAFARRRSSEVVLKLGVPHRELTSEMAALRLFDGNGAVKLLEADETEGMLLLERLQPGKMLATLQDDEEATHIAAVVMLNLWQKAPASPTLIQLTDWFQGFEALRKRFGGTTGPFEQRLVERAERAVQDFFSEHYTPMLIHGDLHHFNILSSQRGWLAIDPKGVVGPAAYEVGPFLLNPWNTHDKQEEIARLTVRRIAIFSERLGFEKERIREWAIAHALLSAWWSLEENTGWEYACACAEIFSSLKL